MCYGTTREKDFITKQRRDENFFKIFTNLKPNCYDIQVLCGRCIGVPVSSFVASRLKAILYNIDNEKRQFCKYT